MSFQYLYRQRVNARLMIIMIRPQQPGTILGAFVFFFILTGIDVRGQTSSSLRPDTLCVLNGHVNILLQPGTYDTVKTEQLLQKYTSVFNVGHVISTCGFILSDNSSLRLYQTSLENHIRGDGDLSTWKLIESFTDKIPQRRWIESKWETHGGKYRYFVNLISLEEPTRFFKFVFFYIDGRLAFSLHEYEINVLRIHDNNHDFENPLSYVHANTHPSKFVGFQEK